METIAVAVLGLNGTLVAALIWLLKSIFTRLFGNSEDQGLLLKFNATLQTMNADLRENTAAIRELQRILKTKEARHGETTTSPDGPVPR